MARHLRVPRLQELLCRFLREQMYPGVDEPDEEVPLEVCPWLPPSTRIALHYSATATFFAPSELCGPQGMHSEVIHCTPHWQKSLPRYDTVLVQISEASGLAGMAVGCVRTFLSFVYGYTLYECAPLEWFELVNDHPDTVTGMWRVKPHLIRGQPH